MTGAQPAGVPPAFRRRPSFVGLDDHQVLSIAAAALGTAQLLPIGSSARAGQWERFDEAMSELTGRGLRHVLRELRGRGGLTDGQAIGDNPPSGAET